VPLDEGSEGSVRADGRVRGTTVHGLFEHDAFRAAFLSDLAGRRGKRFVSAGVVFGAARSARFDTIADAIEAYLDVDALCGLIAEAG
jgi:adenosylcobyric acid synthase